MATQNNKPLPNESLHYNYANQAWVMDGVYLKCGHTYLHPACFACLHHGEAEVQ